MTSEIKDGTLDGSIAKPVILLMALGTAFVFSAGANIVQELDLHHFYKFSTLRQILFFPLAVIIMYAVSQFDYRRLGNETCWKNSPAFYLLLLAIALLILVLIPQLGTKINQARRWFRIPLGPATISFQPSELAKWALIFFLPVYCHNYHHSITLHFKRFAHICSIAAVVIVLIAVEDFGTAAFLTLLTFSILLIAGVKLRYLLTPLPIAIAGFITILITSPYRLQRLAAFLHPEKWADSTAYQATQSLIAIGSGGFFGKGLGRGICKYGHLPEDTTDFIFAVIAEELGLAGTAAIIILFIIFVWLGLLVVIRCEDYFGRLLAAGIVLTISLQAAINIAVVTVMLPTKGIPLPFVSAGGTSMLLTAAAVGVLLNIAKQSPKPSLPEQS